jgi:hypothetical protein
MLTGMMEDWATMLRVFTAYGQTLWWQTKCATVLLEGGGPRENIGLYFESLQWSQRDDRDHPAAFALKRSSSTRW